MVDYVIPPKMMPVLKQHLETYLKDGEEGHLWDTRFAGGTEKTPTLLLFTTGRKSGNKIVLPLIYGKDGDNFIVIASKGGAPAHPVWYLNLLDHPACEIQVANDHFNVLARDAKGEERERLWKMMVELYAPYTDYQAATERKIPVVVLERR